MIVIANKNASVITKATVTEFGPNFNFIDIVDDFLVVNDRKIPNRYFALPINEVTVGGKK